MSASIEGQVVADAKFVTISGHKPTEQSLHSILKNKKVVIFAVPGAFTPTCSNSHLPRYEELYNCFKEQCGIDEVYCLAVNDGFVMQRWFASQNTEKVKMIPDGNCQVAEAFKILSDKTAVGLGKRTRRSAFYVDNCKVVKAFLEAETGGDPFEVSDADTMIKYLKPDVKLVDRIVMFGRKSCMYCQKAETYMQQKKYQYNFIELSEGNKLAVLGALHQGHKTTPLIFVNGEYIGGYDDFVKKF